MSHFPSDQSSKMSTMPQFGTESTRVNEPGGLNMNEINMDVEDKTDGEADSGYQHASRRSRSDRPSSAGDVKPASTKNDVRRLGRVVRAYLARSSWAVLSFIIVATSGIVTGLRSLDHWGGAPLVRSATVLGALCCLAAVTRGVSNTIEKTLDDKEALLCRPLLRKGVIGPRRRWAIWISGLSTGCVLAYLLNEHRPATPTLEIYCPHECSTSLSLSLG